ncbi:hypothetical protein BHM03_00035114 [Ensete ventricosum]|nr:hypothetical protein BHM03_00035114 [Ensete ventricosum]
MLLCIYVDVDVVAERHHSTSTSVLAQLPSNERVANTNVERCHSASALVSTQLSSGERTADVDIDTNTLTMPSLTMKDLSGMLKQEYQERTSLAYKQDETSSPESLERPVVEATEPSPVEFVEKTEPVAEIPAEPTMMGDLLVQIPFPPVLPSVCSWHF